MSTAVAAPARPSTALTTAQHNDAIRTALKSSLYPGASDASVDMVLAYCTATGLDPMTKPVHIVPMSVATGEKDRNGYDITATRDVVMPGIGLYRINATRTGQYAGCSEPEFGPAREMKYQRAVWEDGPNNRRQKRLVEDAVTYPEWCRITVRKLLGGTVVEFSAIEYWIENYASKGDTGEPNSMWAKRPYGQLAKCAEAQALRKAFPEAVGSQPTAEEMEGKDYIDVQATMVPKETAVPSEPVAYPAADFEKNFSTWAGLVASGKKTADEIIAMVTTKGALSAEQQKRIREAAKPKPNPDFPLEGDQDDAQQQPVHGEDA